MIPRAHKSWPSPSPRPCTTTRLSEPPSAQRIFRRFNRKGHVSGGAGGQEFGYLYDFLTLEQREEWHDELAATTEELSARSVVPNTHYEDGDPALDKGPFLRYDLLGGVGMINMADTMALKYMMPKDPAIDWVYRSEVGDNYERLPKGNLQPGYWDDTLLAAIYATDFDASNSGRGRLGLNPTYSPSSAR